MVAWKKTVQVLQTAGDPPKRGRSPRAIIGSMTNSSAAPTSIAPPNRTGKGPPRRAGVLSCREFRGELGDVPPLEAGDRQLVGRGGGLAARPGDRRRSVGGPARDLG